MMASQLESWVLGLSLVILVNISTVLAAERDLRTSTDAVGTTEVSFCSRPSPNTFGFPGHAFVVFSERVGLSLKFRSVGHTVVPGSDVAAAFTYFNGKAVSGKQDEERYTSMRQRCISFVVDREIFMRALEAARPTLSVLGIPDVVAASIERYSLSGSDCMDFIIKVAGPLRPAGLKLPARTAVDIPETYIQKIITANS